MHLTLLVPGLLLPVEILENTAHDLTAPTLSLLLGRGTRRAHETDWLPTAFGLDEPLPAAALRKVGAGPSQADAPPVGGSEPGLRARGANRVGAGETASGEWLCLDPVRWQVAHEGVTLDDPAKLELDEAESTALIAAMQPLFADWGELSASAPDCWELKLKRPLALATQPLPTAIHQAIDPGLPGGTDGPAWRRLLAEAQTVLHAHPVNRQRETDGRPTVNSLWPWGQGGLPTIVQTSFQTVWSLDPVVAGLCRHAGARCDATPERWQPAPGRVLGIVETLAAPARTFDALAWREAVLAFERDWLAPAVAALKRGECTGLQVIGTRLHGSAATVALTLGRGDLLRFWRKPRPLVELK